MAEDKTTETSNETTQTTETQETPEKTTQETTQETITFYSPAEIDKLHPSEIDITRVDPTVRPVVEKAITEYKNMKADHTRKSMELSELKKTTADEAYFPEDPQKDSVFKDFLKNPIKVIRDINSEMAKLETVIESDGVEEYRNARRTIAQWRGIKDEFFAKEREVSNRARQSELSETKLLAELGTEADALLSYAKELGFTEKAFKGQPEVRAAVKKAYTIINAANLAHAKEIKPTPHRAATPGSAGAGDAGILEEVNPNLSTADRIEAMRKRRASGG